MASFVTKNSSTESKSNIASGSSVVSGNQRSANAINNEAQHGEPRISGIPKGKNNPSDQIVNPPNCSNHQPSMSNNDIFERTQNMINSLDGITQSFRSTEAVDDKTFKSSSESQIVQKSQHNEQNDAVKQNPAYLNDAADERIASSVRYGNHTEEYYNSLPMEINSTGQFRPQNSTLFPAGSDHFYISNETEPSVPSCSNLFLPLNLAETAHPNIQREDSIATSIKRSDNYTDFYSSEVARNEISNVSLMDNTDGVACSRNANDTSVNLPTCNNINECLTSQDSVQSSDRTNRISIQDNIYTNDTAAVFVALVWSLAEANNIKPFPRRPRKRQSFVNTKSDKCSEFGQFQTVQNSIPNANGSTVNLGSNLSHAVRTVYLESQEPAGILQEPVGVLQQPESASSFYRSVAAQNICNETESDTNLNTESEFCSGNLKLNTETVGGKEKTKFPPIQKKQCPIKCKKDTELSVAVPSSKENTCEICFEVVLKKEAHERSFGILPNCKHCFCLDCIRKWRQTKFENGVSKACPICRVISHFVCPSGYWVEMEEDKNKLINSYKNTLAMIDCKYFNRGYGKCPFGINCFYFHG